ncbi:MAG: DASS family sodium-coupled anion symporter [Vicinamibacteria bacterium]
MSDTLLDGRDDRFDRARRKVGIWLGPLVGLGLLLAPTGLEAPAHRLLAVTGLVMTWWVSEAIPLAVTALLAPTLAVLLGVAPARSAFAAFGDPVIFLFLGSFLIAEALSVHGLDRRIALAILSRESVARSPLRMRLAVGFVTAALSMWISNTATTAMMLPIVLGLLRAFEAAGSKEPPRGMLLILTVSASLGGLATPVGTPPNLIGLGFLERVAGRSIDFLSFMAMGVPLALALMGVLFVVVLKLVPPARATDLRAYVRQERAALPEWGEGQSACATAFGLAVFLWLLPGLTTLLGASAPSPLLALAGVLDESVVALLAAAVLFVWPVGQGRALNWGHAANIDWGTLMLFGGGLSLGKLMFDTGLAKTLGQAALRATGVESLWGLTALVLLATIVLTETTSNAATVNMLAPLVLSLAQELGVAQTPPLLAVCFGASMAFMFPMGTPPNAIVYGTGLVPLTSMMKVGLIVDALSYFVILAMLWLLCPLLGLA